MGRRLSGELGPFLLQICTCDVMKFTFPLTTSRNLVIPTLFLKIFFENLSALLIYDVKLWPICTVFHLRIIRRSKRLGPWLWYLSGELTIRCTYRINYQIMNIYEIMN